MYSFSSLCEGKSLNLGGLVLVESILPLFAETVGVGHILTNVTALSTTITNHLKIKRHMVKLLSVICMFVCV